MISIIVAVASNQAIGKNNDLLCHIPGDLARFKKITTGHAVVMGKRTWLSLPRRPLSDRTNIVITDDPDDKFEGALKALSLDEAVKLMNPSDENFIIGGASIYRQFLPLCDRLYLTRIHRDFDGDVFFPELNDKDWKEISAETHQPEGENAFAFTHFIYERVK